MTTEIIKYQKAELGLEIATAQMPAAVVDAGAAAQYAWEEFFEGELQNKNTKIAYMYAVRKFLEFCDGLPLAQIRPGHVSRYINTLVDRKSEPDKTTPVSVSTKKLHLAAIRHFFDLQVMRHAVVLNPAASVRGEKLKIVEGRTVPISTMQVRTLLRSIDRSDVIGQRDFTIIAMLAFTLARVGAVAELRVKDYYDGGEQWYLHFGEKGGKSREIPVRHDLCEYLNEYFIVAEINREDGDTPLFRSSVRGRGNTLTMNGMSENNMWRMIKRRLKEADLPYRMTPHSFRAGMATHLLEQGVPIEEVQYLLGHADPRTTKIYDHRKRKVTRNIVERIAISI
jgi:integrase/recombinase XerD